MYNNGMRPVHPGEVLREEYMKPLNLSANALANALGVTAARINEIVRERRGITGDTALRLARYLPLGADPVRRPDLRLLALGLRRPLDSLSGRTRPDLRRRQRNRDRNRA